MASKQTARELWREMVRKRNAYYFIAPFYIMFILFMVFPIAFSFGLSLVHWNGIIEPRFAGLQQYARALSDPLLHSAVFNTAVFTILTVGIGSTVALGLAVFLNEIHILKRFYRGIFFVPSIVSLVVVSLLWKIILNSEVGLLNETIHAFGHLLGDFGFRVPQWTQSTYRFLDNPNRLVPLLTMILVNVWAVVGFDTVIFLAGLQGIPAHLYEVARIDGATPLQNFRYITLPLLRPTTFFVVLISTIDALQVFVLPSIMNPNAESTTTIVYYLYRNAFEYYKMGYASAIAYLLFAITVGLSLVIRYSFGREAKPAPISD
jgi:multiple sugar transport system permease protein